MHKTHSQNRKILRRIIWIFAIVFVLLNVVAIFQAYRFTHFSGDISTKTRKPAELSAFEKIKVLALGVSNPRPVNTSGPHGHFETIMLQSNKKIECWFIKHSPSPQPAKGTVILCHGYSGNKATMLDKAAIFDQLGYNTFLIDFMGSGGSEGNNTTIGYKEAGEVKTAYEYLKGQNTKSIYLFGTSMGAVAIMKAISEYDLQPKGIMLECPFGSMYQTVCNRFRNMNVPAFPMAGLLVFWGGIENGFWAFGHNPTKYAESISCPTLLMYGLKDKNVSRNEIDVIYKNLNGPKSLKLFSDAGHENYLTKYKPGWTQAVRKFMDADSLK